MSLASKTNNQNLINFLVSKAISILSLLYFVSIPLGWTKTKFETDDVVILFIILLFNSELLEKLVKLVISKDGITLDLNQIKETQDVVLDEAFLVHIGQYLGKTDSLSYKITHNTLSHRKVDIALCMWERFRWLQYS